MRRHILIAVCAASAAGLAAGQPWAQDAVKSVGDGVYTDAQAERGHAAYTANCANCHGPDLAGQAEAKPLAGPDFVANWKGLTVGELFDRTRTTMPMDRPGALPPETYADVLAYILKFNGYPAGAKDLDAKSGAFAGIHIDPPKPAS